MRVPLYQVDAFTDRVFGGNPAAVCPLPEWLPDSQLQAIAAENNLSETAFLVETETGYELRWFTPTIEVDLCGHATLASAFVICTVMQTTRTRVDFFTRYAGTLTVVREGANFVLELPSRPAQPARAPSGLLGALGGPPPAAVLKARDVLVVYNSVTTVLDLTPDMAALAAVDAFAVCVTAPAAEPGVDFVSRFFAPAAGVPEDPVTGSAHCTLVPYWAARLGRTQLEGRQVSQRGGAVSCRLEGERVYIAGQAVLYLEGMIHV